MGCRLTAVRHLVILAVLTVAACGDVPTAPAGNFDAATVADATPADASPPALWTFQGRPATGLRRLDDTVLSQGRPQRIGVSIGLAPCERPARLAFIVTVAGTDGAASEGTVTAHVFHPSTAGCSGDEAITRTVELPLDLELQPSGPWLIHADGVATPLSFDVLPGPRHICVATDIGDSCVVDCDCNMANPAVKCIGDVGGTADTGPVCAIPCADSRSCNNGQACVADPASLPVLTCAAGVPECDPTHGCAAGWTCSSGTCAPGTDLASSNSATCTSDAQCTTGAVCIDRGTDALPTCQLPCSSDGWCPPGYGCGFGTIDGSLAGSLCQFIGE